VKLSEMAMAWKRAMSVYALNIGIFGKCNFMQIIYPVRVGAIDF
jgi:hypothetical protein